MKLHKSERKWRQRQRQKLREEQRGKPPERQSQPAANESEFAFYLWDDDLFELAKLPSSRGVSSNSVLLPANRLSVSRWPRNIGAVETYADGLAYAHSHELSGLIPFFGLVLSGTLLLGPWISHDSWDLFEMALFGVFAATVIETCTGDGMYEVPELLSLIAFVLAILVPILALFNGLKHFAMATYGTFLAIAYASIRFSTAGYLYRPMLFDRAAGKVHVFRDKTSIWFPWPLWGGGSN